MTSEGQIFSQQEMSVAMKMKENKAANESGVIAEYLKALEVEEVEKLRGLVNGILNGADIPKEWKESRVKLLHKGGRTDELKNYRPITIINVTCKLYMLMVRERIDKWTEDSGMLGAIQGGFGRERRTQNNLIMLLLLFAMIRSIVKSFKVPGVEVVAARMCNEAVLTHMTDSTQKNLGHT